MVYLYKLSVVYLSELSVISILRKQFKKKRKIFLSIHISFDFDLNVFKEVPNTYNLNDLLSVLPDNNFI